MKRALVALLCLLADCKCREEPRGPEIQKVTTLVVEDASADGSEETSATVARNWIRFIPSTEDGIHGGPEWSFETDLPAIDPVGNVAVPFDATNDLADTPNLGIRTIDPSDHVVSTRWILQDSEFVTAANDPGKKVAFSRLADEIQKRIDVANPLLDSKGYVPMTKCTFDETEQQMPMCTMPKQTIGCGTTKVVYAAQTLTIDGKKLSFPGWKGTPVRTADQVVPVKECFDSMHVDLSRKVLVGLLTYQCQAAGDWCTVDPQWRVVRF